jgi:uncharacterized OsmC-like protein
MSPTLMSESGFRSSATAYQALRRVDPGTGGAPCPCELDGQTRAARNIQEPIAFANTEPMVHRDVLAAVRRFIQGCEFDGPASPALIDHLRRHDISVQRCDHCNFGSFAVTTKEGADVAEEINGVPCDKMFGAIGKMRENGELAQFRFSAKNDWLEGTASRSTIHAWYGIGADQVHVEEFSYDADHPTLGHGHGPTPQEYVLHALAACITAGIATGAAARNIQLNGVSSMVSADIDVRGVLGIDPDIRKGFSNVDIEFDIDADCDDEQKDALMAAGTKYSAVFDMLSNPTEVNVARSS